MPKLTLKQITATTRRLLQDDQYDATTIAEAANWVVYELCNNNRLRIMEESTEIEAALNDTVMPFPDDMMAWTSIYVTAPQVYNFSDLYKEYGDFMLSHANFASSNAAQARAWTDFGRNIRFAAPLNGRHVFQFDYLREPKAMVRDGDVCEIPGRYAELVNRLTKARVLELDEDYQSADEERTLMAGQITGFIRNEGRGGGKIGPTIIRTNRRRREQ